MPYEWPPTLDELRDKLNNPSDSDNGELQGVLDAAVAVLENHPDYRVADAVKSTEYTEWHDAGATVMLKHYPVLSVTSVAEYSGSTVQAYAHEPADGGSFTSYGWDYADGTGDNGILTRTSSGYPLNWTCGTRVKVVYTAGVETVPADLREAALKLAKHMWGDQRGGGSGRAVPGGVGDEFLPPTAAHLLPWEVEGLLEPYKRTPAVA